MKKTFQDRNPIAIGIASVLVIGALVGFAFMVGILHLLENTYTVRGEFIDAAGMRGGDDVRVAGVKAGRVTSIKADRQNGKVIIEFEVNSGVELGPETRAEVALGTLLGTKYMRLSGAVPEEGPYLEDLEEERRLIPIERTKTPFDIFELTKIGTRSIQATDTEKLNQFISQVADITEGNAADVQKLVHSLADVASALGARDAEIRQLLERLNQLSGLLAEKDQTLVTLIDESQAVLDLVSRRRGDIVTGLRGGEQLASHLGALVASHKTQLDLILTTLHPTIDILARRGATVDRALAWIGPGAFGLSLPPTHGPWNDVYVRAIGPDLVELLQDTLGDPDAETTP